MDESETYGILLSTAKRIRNIHFFLTLAYKQLSIPQHIYYF